MIIHNYVGTFVYILLCNCSTLIGPEDYTGGTYQVTFETGKTTAQFNISINDDNVCEREEMFVAMLEIPAESNMFGIMAGMPSKATVKISDDDGECSLHTLNTPRSTTVCVSVRSMYVHMYVFSICVCISHHIYVPASCFGNISKENVCAHQHKGTGH